MAVNGVPERSTLAYSPLFMLPLKKTIIDGNPSVAVADANPSGVVDREGLVGADTLGGWR